VTCWKCQGSLKSLPASRDATPPTAAPSFIHCPHCGKPSKPGTAKCPVCETSLVEASGLRCSHCNVVNPPGVSACVKCGGDMLNASSVTDVTAKDLGVELADGRMAVLIPNHTPFPTRPIGREFYTAVAAQQRLEVMVYEGDEPTAAMNDLCGMVTMSLPDGLPRGTAVNIALGLDDDRTITVKTKLRTATGEAKDARLQRAPIDPERRRKIEERRDRVTKFIDKWSIELSGAERASLFQLIDSLDGALAEGNDRQQRTLDLTLSQADQRIGLIADIRGKSAIISNILGMAGKYLPLPQQAQLEQFQAGIENARERADWQMFDDLNKQTETAIADIAPNTMAIVYALSLAGQRSLSPSLTQRVYATVRNIDEGISTGNRERFEQGMDTLHSMWDEIRREMEASGKEAPVITRPVDKEG